MPKYDITQIKAGDTFWGKITDVNLPNAKVRVLIDNATYVECKYPTNAYNNSIKNGYNVAIVVTKVIEDRGKYRLIGKSYQRIPLEHYTAGRSEDNGS